MRRIWVWVVGAALLAGPAIAASLRTFPPSAQRATLKWIEADRVKLGDRTLPLAPGLQIRNTQNLIVMPGSVADARNVAVRVQFDTLGAVWRIWFLTPEEAQAR